MERNLVRLRNYYRYFNKNKSWILSILFVCSIVRDVIWHSCFGINILTYSSIQDAFISFFNYTFIFSIIIINYILWMFLDASKEKNTFFKISLVSIKFIGIIFFSCVFYLMSSKILSFLELVLIFFFQIMFIQKKEYLNFFKGSILLLLFFSTVGPLIQYHYLLNGSEKDFRNGHKYNESNTEYFSFEYESRKYDTNEFNYHLIGINTEYFFIFDRSIERTLIIPKSECKNIKTDVFNLANLRIGI